MLKQVTWRGCRIFTLGDNKKLTGHGLRHLALGQSALIKEV